MATSLGNLRDHLCVADSMHRANFVSELQRRVSAELAQAQEFAEPQDWRARIESCDASDLPTLEAPPAEQAALREIVIGIAFEDLRQTLGPDAITQSIRQAFEGLEGGTLGFFEAFMLYFAWQLKTVDNLRRSVVGGKVASLDAIRLTPTWLLNELYDVCAQIASRFDRYLQYPVEAEQAQTAFPGGDRLWWLRPLSAHAADMAEGIAAHNKLPFPVFQPILNGLSANRDTPASAEAAVNKIWIGYHDAMVFLTHGTHADPSSNEAMQQAAFLLEEGRTDAALELLAQAEAALDNAEMTQEDRQEARKSLAVAMARLYGLQGEDKLASQAYVKALAHVPRERGEEWASLAIAIIHAIAGYCGRGQNPSEFKPVDETAAILLAQIEKSQDRMGWALLKAAYASALVSAAALRRWPAKLEAGCKAFREALEALPDEAHPALRERVSLDLALAQADYALLKKEAALMREAARALAQAFEESRPQLTPAETADCLAKLGLIQAELAMDGKDGQLADEAEARFQEAIEIAEDQGLWLKWPVLHGHRAENLLRCAQWSREGNWFEPAVQAYETALQFCPREIALSLLSGLADAYFAGRFSARNPMDAVRSAALVYELAEEEAVNNGSLASLRVQLARKRGTALMWLARMAKRPKLFQAADDAFRLALSLCEEISQPVVRAALQHDIAVCLAAEGEADQNVMLLKDAAAIFERALEARKPTTHPRFYAQSANALGDVLRKIAAMNKEAASAQKAVRLLETALAVAKKSGDDALIQQVEKTAAAARKAHGELTDQKRDKAGVSQQSAAAKMR